jgi:2-keto-4-pentenoate hydratase/2-oxohepta-3-ene-1,7-dioic acid hydratase in catechol pathway
MKYLASKPRQRIRGALRCDTPVFRLHSASVNTSGVVIYGQVLKFTSTAGHAYNGHPIYDPPAMPFAFDPPPIASLPIHASDARFPIHRIYCIGRNYAAHAKEMGSATVSRAHPVFFLKPADTVVPEGGDIPYPSATQQLHHEVEMVVALAAGGHDIDAAQAMDCVFGYGVGLDLTRRDLQAAMKANGMPWDVAKGFDHAAPVSALRAVAEIGHPATPACRWRSMASCVSRPTSTP